LDLHVEQISVSPNDDRHVTINMYSGLTMVWRIDGEIRAWIEGLQRMKTQVRPWQPLPSDTHIRDILHCWQPDMQSDSSSCVFYSLQTLPHLAQNVHLETVTGIAAAAVMWFSHGGATLSFALLPDQEICSPVTSPMTTPRSGGLRIEIPGKIASPRGESEALPLSSVVARNLASDVAHQGECTIDIIGCYLSDIVSVRHDTRETSDADLNRFCLELAFTDGVRLRLCYNSRYMRLACQHSINRLRTIVDERSADIDISSPRTKQSSMMAAMGLVSAPSAFVTGGGIQPPSYRPPTGSSQDQPPPPGWQGLSGAMEIKILSASKLGLTEGGVFSDASFNFAVGANAGSKQSAKPRDRGPLPCPRVVAYLPTQPPPSRLEVRSTPDLPERTANPIWNNTWIFTVEYSKDDPPPADIRLEVWNVDGRNEFLGEVTVPFPLEDCVHQHHLDLKKNPIKLQDKTKTVNGSLSCVVSFEAEHTDKSATAPLLGFSVARELRLLKNFQFKCICGTLGVEIVRAIGLRSADLLTSDPYCSVLVGSAPRQLSFWKTAVRFGTLNPVWREVHEFKINWPLDELEHAPEVKLEIWDFDSSSNDEFLGEITFALPHADGENFVDMEVQPNRSKSPNTVKGRLQARVYFKNQYGSDEPEGLDPYEKTFCEYFGTRVVDEQFARTIAPPLIFFHLGWRRILFSQVRDAWRRASYNLLASKSARGLKSRAQCYLELASSLCFATCVASVLLIVDFEPIGVGKVSASIGGFVAAVITPCPARVLANFIWHRPEPHVMVGHMGLGDHSPGTPSRLGEAALILSVLGLGAFLSLAKQEAVDNLWLAAAVIVGARLLVFPLLRSLRMTWMLSSAKVSKRYDWFFKLFPSVTTAHGALLEGLPWKMLAPPA
jgi:hypothetical protein